MPTQIEIENQAGLARVTCGWKRPELSLDFVRPYWRDVHSPAIARRKGVYEYRHYPLDPVRADLFAPVPGVGYAAPADAQLMWLSDVRYFDEAAMNIFGDSPPPAEKALLLNDIEMIVDQSTTYKVVGKNAETLADATGNPAPSGPAAFPTFEIFIRQKGDEASFRAAVRAMAERWAKVDGVVRVRLNLFDVPDMEAERAAGYPIKTHPLERQYQAWIDLVLRDEGVAKGLITPNDGVDYAAHISEIHAYPSPAVYTFNYNGRPTVTGLRGYNGYVAINNLKAEHARHPDLLTWLYGDVVDDGPFA